MNNPSTCPHFISCSGCTLGADWNMPPVWKEALKFFKRYRVEPKIFVEGFEKTRLKAKLAIQSPLKIGLYKEDTHEVLDIPFCKVHHPQINKAVDLIKEAIKNSKESIYDEKTGVGNLRYLQLFVEKKTSKVQLVIVSQSDLDSELKQQLLNQNIWHSIWLNIHKEKTNAIFGTEWIKIMGQTFLWQTLNNTNIAFHPAAFAQVHLSLFEKLIQNIDRQITSNQKILELYAGVGSIGLCLHKKAKFVHMVENNPFAHLCFLESSKDLKNVSYECMDVKHFDFDADVYIVDPPRKGLEDKVLQKLSQKEGKLFYVSCNFETFKKDAVELILNEWRIKEAYGYLLFAGTDHIEILATFEK